ncbi:EamA family transporter [Sphingomonas sp. SUN039]|nr:EamA family transporter [Sphingomonas sp. SUN039]
MKVATTLNSTAPSSILSPRVLIPFTIATVIWGSTWFVIRDQLGVVPPTWSVAYRFLTGSAAMFAWALMTRAPLRIGREGQVFAALFGLAQFVLNFNFIYRAEDHIASGLVAVVFALLIVPNAILGRIFLKSPLSGRFLTGSAVALVGVALLIVQELRRDGASAQATLIGVTLTLLGLFSASVANIMQGTERARALPMASVLAWGMLWGGLMNVALALPTVGAPVFEPRLSYWLGVVYLGVAASAVAFTCYFGVIRAIGPARAAYSGVLTPILAMLISTLFEDYRWTTLAAAGGVVAMAGLLIALSARKPATKSG